jgi:hypothetical protein
MDTSFRRNDRALCIHSTPHSPAYPKVGVTYLVHQVTEQSGAQFIALTSTEAKYRAGWPAPLFRKIVPLCDQKKAKK